MACAFIIESVKFNNVKNNLTRGDIIATFKLRVRDWETKHEPIYAEALTMVQALIEPIYPFGLIDRFKSVFGEQNGCWITRNPEGSAEAEIRVIQKDLSPDQIKAFRKIIEVVGPLYKWTISEELTEVGPRWQKGKM